MLVNGLSANRAEYSAVLLNDAATFGNTVRAAIETR